MSEHTADVATSSIDPATIPPDDVSAAFIEALRGDDESTDGVRYAALAKQALTARPLAADAQGFAVALVDWARQDLLPALDPELSDLPGVSRWEDLKHFLPEIASHATDAEDQWHEAYRAHEPRSDAAREQWHFYSALEAVREATVSLLAIPKYRVPDPKWKAKRPRPTAMSCCLDAASRVGDALLSGVEIADDVEWTLDRLGLSGDAVARTRAARARRALANAGFDAPGPQLVSFAERLCAAVDAAPKRPAEQLAEAAIAAVDAQPAMIVAENDSLASMSVPGEVDSVAQAARVVLLDLGQRLVVSLIASTPARAPVHRPASASTPVQSPPHRPEPEELARRIERSVERGRRTTLDALRELDKLSADVTAGTRRRVLEAIVAATLGDKSHAETLAAARLQLGAITGRLVLLMQPRQTVRETHLWMSDPNVDADDDRFPDALCGKDLRRESGPSPLLVWPTRSDRSRPFGAYGYERKACADCERVAIAEELLDREPAGEEKRPTELVDQLIACLEHYHPPRRRTAASGICDGSCARSRRCSHATSPFTMRRR